MPPVHDRDRAFQLLPSGMFAAPLFAFLPRPAEAQNAIDDAEDEGRYDRSDHLRSSSIRIPKCPAAAAAVTSATISQTDKMPGLNNASSGPNTSTRIATSRSSSPVISARDRGFAS